MQNSYNHPTVHVKLIILATILLLVMSGQAMAADCDQFFSGSGTESDPFQIANSTALQNLSENSACWDKNINQTADINATNSSNWNGGDGFSPIGNDTTSFTGTYNGQGHTITGLTIDRDSTDNIGLFGATDSGVTIENVQLTDVHINGNLRVGGLVGWNDGTVSNSTSSGSVNGTGNVGALAGRNNGTVQDVHAYGLVFGAENSTVAGGLVGHNSGNMTECYSTAHVESYGAAGGLVGNCTAGDIRDSYATGDVTGTDNIGGLVGQADKQAEIIRTYYAQGQVALSAAAATNASSGGLIGEGNASVNSSYWDQWSSSQSSSAGGERLSTPQMRNSTSYNASWNFGPDNTWNRDDDYNGGYPYLTNSTLFSINATKDPDEWGSSVDWTGKYPEGATAQLLIYPEVGYSIDEVTGCSGSRFTNEYTIDPVSSNCTVDVQFEELKTNANASCDPASIGSGSEEFTDLDDISATYKISEDYTDGDSDQVHFTYAYEGNTTASANGTANATAWLGGFTPDTFNATELPPAQIVVVTADGNETAFEFGPHQQQNNGTLFRTDKTGSFNASVGDNVHVEIGSLCNCSANQPDIANATSNSGMLISAEPYYVLTVNSGSNGGEYLNGTEVNISADSKTGKSFDSWTGDTQYLADSGSSSTTLDMPAKDISVTATYDNLTYTVSASAGAGGSIDPNSQTVTYGNDATFTVTPDTGYKINTVTGCSGSLDGSTYTTGSIYSDCTVQARFVGDFAGGDGSQSDPYRIETPEQLDNVRNMPDGEYFEIKGDLDVSTLDSWTPLGSDSPFTGTILGLDYAAITGLNGTPLFDQVGLGADIADISISGSEMTDATGPAGLFANEITGNASNRAELSNITLDQDCSISAGEFENNIGALSGRIEYADLENITINSDVNGTGDNTGAIGGSVTDAEIVVALINADVSGNDNVGGIGGNVANTDLQNININGSVQGSDNVGGISGTMDAGSVQEISIWEQVNATAGTQGFVQGATGASSPTIQDYRITATSGDHGSISPLFRIVDNGDRAKFKIRPQDGYKIDYVTGCGGNLSGNTYTTDPTGNCNVEAGFIQKQIKYSLTVIDGSGGGNYVSGEEITIQADSAPTGQEFDAWTGDKDHVEDVNSASTALTMPESNVSVTATYKDILVERYSLTVNQGAGGGKYKSGRTVSIAADAPPEGEKFDTWTGDTGHVAEPDNPNTSVGIPKQDITVTATYKPKTQQKYSLTVDIGTGSGIYDVNQTISIAAEPAAEGEIFAQWAGDIEGIANRHSPNTSLTMPAQDIYIQATYKAKSVQEYTLSVASGTGSGDYTAGEQVNIAAQPAAEGKIFQEWTGDVDYIKKINHPNTELLMPEEDIEVQANYQDKSSQEYTLSVGSGTGSGEYGPGESVSVSAEPAEEGMAFNSWTGDRFYLHNPDNSMTYVVMPEDNVSITASYEQTTPDEYSLEIKSGTGSGEYQSGYVVNINAQPAAEGKVFDQWVGQTSRIANTNLPNTVLEMPTTDVQVEATYKSDPGEQDPRELEVKNGTGDGEYKSGRVVSIAADVRDEYIFDSWEGQTSQVQNVNIPNTAVHMPKTPVEIEATYKPDPDDSYTLTEDTFIPERKSAQADKGPNNTKFLASVKHTVLILASDMRQVLVDDALAVTQDNDGVVISNLPAGSLINLVGPEAPEGYVFDKWIGQTSHVQNINLSETMLYMPDNDVNVIASYKLEPQEVDLQVENGSGDGSYEPGKVVDIEADSPKQGRMFVKWEGQTANVENINLNATTLLMPGSDVSINAVYQDIPDQKYTLTVQNGKGGGKYQAGKYVQIQSKDPPPEQMFARWKGQIANVQDVNADETSIYMPANNATIKASFSSYHEVTAFANKGVSIEPSGVIDVPENERQSFTITPNAGYSIESVDGCSGTSLTNTSYTTGPIKKPCTVQIEQSGKPDSSLNYFGCVMNPDAGLDWGLMFILTGLGMYVLVAYLRKRFLGPLSS